MNALNTTTPRPELFASVTSSDTEGLLDVNVTSEVNNRPIDGAKVQITRDSDPEQIIEQTTTNSLGQIPELTLPAPPVDYSMEPGINHMPNIRLRLQPRDLNRFASAVPRFFPGKQRFRMLRFFLLRRQSAVTRNFMLSRIIRFGEIIRQRLRKMRLNPLMRPARSY